MKLLNNNAYIYKLMEEKVKVTIFTVNGFQMKGYIDAMEDNALIITRPDNEKARKQSYISLNAISTITPEAPVDINS